MVKNKITDAGVHRKPKIAFMHAAPMEEVVEIKVLYENKVQAVEFFVVELPSALVERIITKY